MSDVQLSPDLIRFIQTFLPSYDAAVILVFLSREPERAWTVDQAVRAMSMEPDAADQVRQHVEHFLKAGVLVPEEGGFRLLPSTETAWAMVEELRIAYDRRPVTLIRAIDSAARAKIQSFADAFRLKRDRE